MNTEAPVELPRPERTPLNEPYWQALENGQLLFQRCSGCGRSNLPARAECPQCMQPTLEWRRSSGAATLVSWIVYHQSFHPAFAKRIPYIVAIVELAEGARLATNLSGVESPSSLRIDMPLILSIERDDGLAVPRFRPVTSDVATSPYDVAERS
jgi:uncharacterized OB-fold protein